MWEDGVVHHARDHKRKFEVPEGMSVFKDLHDHPVLKGDVGHVGRVFSPNMDSQKYFCESESPSITSADEDQETESCQFTFICLLRIDKARTKDKTYI